jgi:Tfp pilus assembly pilus retraction ATPase PilT
MNSLLKLIKPFDVEKFRSILEVSIKESQPTRDKDIILFYGTTGSGKSTSIAFLVGEEMIMTDN